MLLNQEVDGNVTTVHPSQLGQFPGKNTVRCIENRKGNEKKKSHSLNQKNSVPVRILLSFLASYSELPLKGANA